MESEDIKDFKILIDQAIARLDTYLAKKIEGMKDTIDNTYRKKKVTLEEYEQLNHYYEEKLEELYKQLQRNKQKEVQTKKIEKEDDFAEEKVDLKEEFRKRIVSQLSITPSECKKISEEEKKRKKLKEKEQEETEENTYWKEEFRKRVISPNSSKEKEKKPILKAEDKKSKIDLIDIQSKEEEKGIRKRASAYDGTMIDLSLEEQKEKGEGR